MASVCSIDGCKRAVTCLCRHCQKDVCSKHFNEHQIQVNNELIPITDRLNECKNNEFGFLTLEYFYLFIFIVKMRLKVDNNDPTNPFSILQTWKNKKYQEIDNEYNRKVDELKTKILKHDQEINQTISNIQELLNEGDVSIDQVKQMQKTIENLTNRVNQLLSSQSNENMNELNLQGKQIQMGGLQYIVKAKISCNNKDLYALESERALTGYDGLCPQCDSAHVLFKQNRGMYAFCQTIHEKIGNIK